MSEGRWALHEGDCRDVLPTLPDASVDAVLTDPPSGIAFMDLHWDTDKGGRDQWIAWLAGIMAECRRVIKPGGHALVWALPRTSHWTAMALEDAGFEIRDSVHHLFGTGYPKSADVSKAIDRMAGAERERTRPVAVPARNRDGTLALGGGWQDDPWETAPATDDARQWAGWGTALKPAHEVWWLARAPLAEKTIAANVLEYGTGALNIDASRIPGLSTVTTHRAEMGYHGGNKAPEYTTGSDSERWPANVVFTCPCPTDQHLDGCPVGDLDRQSGVTRSGGYPAEGGVRPHVAIYGTPNARGAQRFGGSEGGASRFFYVAKASPSERALPDGTRNPHPTIKPLQLMRYLCRLITPPGGVVLDPFAGSGTTGMAAILEHCRFVGIEQDAAYAAIARGRIGSVAAQGSLFDLVEASS